MVRPPASCTSVAEADRMRGSAGSFPERTPEGHDLPTNTTPPGRRPARGGLHRYSKVHPFTHSPERTEHYSAGATTVTTVDIDGGEGDAAHLLRPAIHRSLLGQRGASPRTSTSCRRTGRRVPPASLDRRSFEPGRSRTRPTWWVSTGSAGPGKLDYSGDSGDRGSHARWSRSEAEPSRGDGDPVGRGRPVRGGPGSPPTSPSCGTAEAPASTVDAKSARERRSVAHERLAELALQELAVGVAGATARSRNQTCLGLLELGHAAASRWAASPCSSEL